MKKLICIIYFHYSELVSKHSEDSLYLADLFKNSCSHEMNAIMDVRTQTVNGQHIRLALNPTMMIIFIENEITQNLVFS